MRILKITPVYFMRPVVVFFRVFSLFVVHPWKLTNIPWKLMVGRWNFLLNSSLFSGDVNLQVSSPGIFKEENMKKRKLPSISRYHHQVSWGVWFFSPYPTCRPDCPSGVPRTSWPDARRRVLGVFLEDKDHQMLGGSPTTILYGWLGFRTTMFFGKGLSSSKRNHLFLLMVVDYQGMGPKHISGFPFFGWKLKAGIHFWSLFIFCGGDQRIQIHGSFEGFALNSALLGLVIYGGFLKWWYPTTIGFPTKMIILGCFGGTPI